MYKDSAHNLSIISQREVIWTEVNQGQDMVNLGGALLGYSWGSTIVRLMGYRYCTVTEPIILIPRDQKKIGISRWLVTSMVLLCTSQYLRNRYYWLN